MTDPRHARIRDALGTLPSASHRADHAARLANITAQVAQQYTLTRSGSTPDPDKGNVPVPVVDPVMQVVAMHRSIAEKQRDPAYRRAEQAYRAKLTLGLPIDPDSVDSSWNYTLPEEYQA